MSWRTPTLTRSLLDHLARQWPDLDVYLVECGGSVPGPLPERVTASRHGNLGYAGGNNAGIELALAAGKRYVLVVNSDAVPLSGSVEQLADVLDNDAEIAACGAALVRSVRGQVEINAGTSFDWTSGDTAAQPAVAPSSAVDFACGAVLLLRASTLRKVGGFDAHFFLYYEDLDWAERVRAAGQVVHVSPGAMALHAGSVSTGAAPKAATFYRARNRLWVLRRHGRQHGGSVSFWRESWRLTRMVGRTLLSGDFSLLVPQLAGTVTGMVRPPPEVNDDPAVSVHHQRWEARDRRVLRVNSRWVQWISQPEVVAAPVRAVKRRLIVDISRRVAPGLLERERLVELDQTLCIWARLSDDIERSIFLLGTYDHAAVRAFERLVIPSGVAVDVGAHVGQFTLMAARAVGESGSVFAFEPQKRIYQRLLRNISENGFTNVATYETALGSEVGTARLHSTENDTNSGLAAVCSAGAGCRDEHIEVPITTLDEVLMPHASTLVDVIKLDVEGYELEALRGAARLIDRDHPAIIIEANDIEATDEPPSSDSLAYLDSFGYKFFGIGPAAGDAPHLHRLLTGRQVHALRQHGRPISLVALHEEWRGYKRALRWVEHAS